MKRIATLFIVSLSSLLVIPSACTWLTKPSPSPDNLPEVISPAQIQDLLQATSVKIFNAEKQGSGVLIAKEGQTYTVLTTAHVIRKKELYQIQTSDGQVYQAKIISRGNPLEGNDLAVLEFASPQTYQVISLATTANLKENQTVYAAGFASESPDLSIAPGKIALIPTKSFVGGYQIGYTSDIREDISGGSLLNQKGELIGVNGWRSQAIFNKAHTYQDGSRPTDAQIKSFQDVSFAIPIKTLVLVAPNLAVIPREWKTGVTIVEKVDRIAQQITVRLDSKKNGNGSGVIIGKQGQTYYVVTAKRIVKNPEQYQIVTPDGEKYTLKAEDILTSEGLEAALIKFNSPKTYQVATIGRYGIPYEQRQWVFLSGFPSSLSGTRKLTSGFRFNRDKGLTLTTDNFSLDFSTTGYELIYTNLTEAGMSGGPVIDAKGQVIGINAGVEEEDTSLEDTIQVGLAFGVSSSSFLRLATKKGILSSQLNIITTAPQELTQTEVVILKTHPSFAVEKPSTDAKATDWLNYGNQLWRLQRFEEAVKALQRAIILKPDFYQAYYALGLVYDSQGEYQQALEQFERVIKLRPNYYKAWREKSSLLFKLEKYSEALIAIERAIFNSDNDFNLYLKQGAVLYFLGRFDAAKQAYTKSIEINPNFPAYQSRGNMRSLTNDLQGALADFNRAIELQPESADSYLQRGFLLYKLQDYRGASADYTKRIELEPNNAKYYADRGGFLSLIHDYQGAIKDLNKAIELEPNNADYYSQRGRSRDLMADIRGALEDFNKAIELEPKANYYLSRANSRSTLPDYRGALADYNQAIELQPKYVSAYVQRGFLRTSIFKDDSGAMADYERAINLLEKDPEVWEAGIDVDWDSPALRQKRIQENLFLSQNVVYILRGNLHCKLDKYQEATEDYNQAISQAPQNGERYISRGDCYAKSKEPDKAKADYHQAIELLSEKIAILPEYHLLYNQRAGVRKKLQDYQGAIADYTKALELVPRQVVYYMSRGGVRLQLAEPDYQGAIEDFTKAIEIQPNNYLPYGVRANIRYKLKDYQRAFADISKSIELLPKETPQAAQVSYLFRCQIRLQLLTPNYKGAIQDCSEIIKFQPNNLQGFVFRGIAYIFQKDYQEAMADFQTTIKLQPNLPVGYWGQGVVHYVKGNYKAALSDFNLALAKDQNYWRAISSIGSIKYETRNISEAISLWQQAVKIGKKDAASTQLALAVALYNQGKTEKAYSMAREALELNKRLGNIEYLKRDLWGKLLIADTQKLFSTPRMQAFLAKK